MDPFTQSIYLVQKSNNILILPPNQLEQNSLEPILNLYYTLKKIGKNVNLKQGDFQNSQTIDEKEFVLSINIVDKELNKMYYEKSGKNLNIHLGLNQGKITNDDISIQEKQRIQNKIELIISLGQKEINLNDDNFEFFSQKPIINIDNQTGNKIFGQVNLVFPNLPLNKIVDKLVDKLEENENTFNKSLFRKIIEKLRLLSPQNIYFVMLKKDDFQNTKSKPKDIALAIRKLKLNPYLNLPNLILLWEYHHSPSSIKGVCFDGNIKLAQKILNHFNGQRKGNGAIFEIKADNLNLAKEQILKIL